MKRRLALLLAAALLMMSGCAALPEPDDLHELEDERENYQPIPQPESEAPEEAPVYPEAFALPYHPNQTLDPVS